ncbi:metallophosphoesterase [Sporolactobacillus sp. CPB3-1]|uniref:Metallophosphoesterase n=1 Tax=Sporolactobacillus mangiferae TaxID=2940498 RepID=A0ABT0M9H7_9BACL|nr:metallophosphoesterase [Sporolactobacillus mangiferae]MCL1631527.1 metallophosphoesterase [Sporolactobacillus mangiferae]
MHRHHWTDNIAIKVMILFMFLCCVISGILSLYPGEKRKPAVLEVNARQYIRHTVFRQPVPKPRDEPKVAHKLFKGIDSVDFTFGVLPDTQYYSRSHPDIFKRMNRWFVTNRDALKLRYIFHLGDIVDNYNRPYQWKNADQAMRILDESRVPYGIITGNHDVGFHKNYRIFDHYFGESRYMWNPWYGGSYDNNKGHYDLINTNGQKYIMLGMGWDIGGEEIAWMNHILHQYRNRIAILFFHDYLGSYGKRSSEGQMLFERVVRVNPNVRMVMNGHRYGAARRVDKIDDDLDGKPDRKVMQILSDYQSVKGGQGYIRVLGFDLTHDKVYVRTFSPQVHRTHVFKKNKDNFSFSFDLDKESRKKRMAH